MRKIVVGTVALLALAGCGGGGDGRGAGTRSGGDVPTAHTIVSSGFGQPSGSMYARVVATVRNDTDTAGQSVVAQFNLLDSAGEILVSADQTESFAQPGQDLILGTQVTVPEGKRAAKVEVTVDVSDSLGVFQRQPVLPVRYVSADKTEFGDSYEATLEVSNPSAEAVRDVRLGMSCVDASGRVIGAGSAYPDLVGPSGKIRLTVDTFSSVKPASCVASAATS